MCVYVCIFLTYVQLIIYKNPEHNTRNDVLLWEKKTTQIWEGNTE